MDEPKDNLLTDDHAALDALLEQTRHEDRGDFWKGLDYFWARLAMHIRAEHLHLFPAILNAVGGRPDAKHIIETIDALQADHSFFMRELARIMRSREADQMLDAVAERLRAHNDIEESQIYPLTDSLLPDAGQRQLVLDMKAELTNLPKRFRTPENEANR